MNDTASTQQQYQHILLSNAALSAIDHSLCPLDSYTSIYVSAQMQQYAPPMQQTTANMKYETMANAGTLDDAVRR